MKKSGSIILWKVTAHQTPLF